MSLGVPALQCQTVLDERINIDSIRRYNIFRGGKNVSWKPITTQSYSTSSIQFTAPPPNPAIIVDREIYLLMSMQLTIEGVANAAPFLNIGVNDALRAYPLSNGLINTLQATINNTSVSVNMSDVIEPLLRYNVPEFKRGKIFSMTPSMQDQFQEYFLWTAGLNTTAGKRYEDTVKVSKIISGSARHPLGGYGTISGDEMARGGFQTLSIVSNAVADGKGTAVIDVLLCEPLFLSPFLFGGEGPGFIGVQTMDFNFTLNAEPGRIWSRYDIYNANPNPDDAAINYIKDIKITLGNGKYAKAPTLLFNYITPGELMPIHREYVYPYYNIDRYTSETKDIAGLSFESVVAYNDSSVAKGTTFNSNNIQLQSIPRRIYICAREANDARLRRNDGGSKLPALNGTSNAKDYYAGPWNHSDTYGVITAVNVNWNNNAGLLSSSSSSDLYRIAVNNGCQLSWNQWNGDVGSVLALDFGKDIQLGDLEAPGKLMTSQLQIDVTIRNQSPYTRSLTLYIIVVSEGTFTIVDNRCITQIGVVSENDIFEASKSRDHQVHTYVQNIYGGDFFGGLKHLIKEGAHKATDMGIDLVAKELGGELSGAGYSGGKLMSRSALKKRMK